VRENEKRRAGDRQGERGDGGGAHRGGDWVVGGWSRATWKADTRRRGAGVLHRMGRHLHATYAPSEH